MSIILGASLLVSCQYKDFADYDGTVAVKVIADYSKSGATHIPAVTRAVFMPFDMGRQDFTYDVKDSSMVDLPSMRYRVFAYNNDSQINRTRGYMMSDGSPIIRTDPADKRGVFKTDSLDRTVHYDWPDITYAWFDKFDASAAQPDGTTRKVVMRMKRVTRPVTVEVRGVKHAELIQGVRMAIDGVQREYSPVTSFNHSYVSVIADGAIDSLGLKGTFSIFGAGYPMGHKLTVFLDGGNFHKVLRFDVTDQVNDQRFGMGEIKIAVTADYDVKDDAPVNSSFNIGVSDWQDEPISVKL